MLLPLFASCQQDEPASVIDGGGGEFIASIANEYSFTVTTKSVHPSAPDTIDAGDFAEAQMTEESWTGKSVRRKGILKSAVTGDDVEWTDEPLISVYLTDADDESPLVYGVPLNAKSSAIYNRYGIKNGGTPESITGSKFFWDTWSKKDSIAGKNVNFYGYYPRPKDFDDWEYRRNSIIERESATNTGYDWNRLSYTFYINQTDDNLSYFDLMYSIPEEANANGSNRHGNRNKTGNDNIQMAFSHAFSLLNIEICRGDEYEGDCEISSLSLSGTQVFTKGILDIMKGEITPSSPDAIIRTITSKKITDDSPFSTQMIVQPTTDNPDAGSTDNDRMVLSCTIDGAVYTCPLPSLKLQGGKKYNLKLTVSPSGATIFRIWNGASVTIGGKTYSAGEKKLTTKSESFTATPSPGFKIVRVLKNGQEIQPDNGAYAMDQKTGANTYYNIVTVPDGDWYQDIKDIRLLFDAKWNDKYGSIDTQTADILFWSDLTGNGNDGTLQSFNNTSTSGWGDNCLTFDGLDDIVRYPGNISSGDFTIELYIYVFPTQYKIYGRLFAEDEKTGYPSLCLKTASDESKGNISLCGNGVVDHGLPNTTNVLGKLVQIDYVFKADGKRFYLYMNGEQKHTRTVPRAASTIPEASLGNRIADNTRALKAKYYNFIIYDKALSQDEMKANLSLNTARFGTPTAL